VKELGELRAETNISIIKRLREDSNAESLYEACCSDARLGRMSHPAVLEAASLDACHLSPRFGVVQGKIACVRLFALVRLFMSRCAGVRADGSIKVRPVDDMSRSLVNAAAKPSEKLRYDSLDGLLQALRFIAVRSKVSFHCLCVPMHFLVSGRSCARSHFTFSRRTSTLHIGEFPLQ